MKKIFSEAHSAVDKMSNTQLADLLERINPETYDELDPRAAKEILQQISKSTFISADSSFHVCEERHLINGHVYSVMHAVGDDEVWVSLVTKNDYSHIRNRDPQQLSLF